MAGSAERHARLLSPIDLAGRRLRHRAAFASLSTRYVAGGLVNDRLIGHLESRAAGGAAMIVSEAMAVHPSGTEPARIWLYTEKNGDGLRRLAEAVESRDCRLLGQLWHNGRARLTGRADNAVGVSALPDGISWTVPHPLSTDEVRAIVDAYVAGAVLLQDCGFSGIEISSAHGFLPLQFLSPWSNRREDVYGGDLDGRTRFLREVLTGIRQSCGAGFIVGVKMPADDGVPDSIDADEAGRITGRILADMRPDYICYSQGNHWWNLRNHAPDMHYPPAPFLHLHKRLRAAADGVPVGVIGRISTPDEAEAALADGSGDIVFMARPWFADAAWGRKAADGRDDEIRLCIACNACWGAINRGQPAVCSNNPRAGTAGEADWRPEPAARPRRVVVVGGGVAGLEAAWLAAARGHAVTLLSASEKAGGKARWHASLPGCADIARVFDWQLARALAHGVTLRLGAAADAAAVLALDPEAVVLATGSRMAPPEGLAAQEPVADLRAATAALLSEGDAPRAGTAVLFDEDHTPATYAAAELLARRFARVVLLTSRETVAKDVPILYAQGVHRRLAERGVTVVPFARPARYGNGRLVHANLFTGQETEIEDVALFTHATARVPETALAAPLRAAGLEPVVIGDAWAPRAIVAAVADGHRAAAAL